MSRNPDLVFLDFTCNDGIDQTTIPPLQAYETILRKLISHGVLVQQQLFCFKSNVNPLPPGRPARMKAHSTLASAYQTAVGDGLGHMADCLEKGETTLQAVWPLDGAHPDDIGYEIFFQAARDGFDAAVAEGRICVMPNEPLLGPSYRKITRDRLVDHPLPAGWKREMTYRTSMWFDGLSSRWMGDVAGCSNRSAEKIEPLVVPFEGTFVGLLGEGDNNSLAFRVLVDDVPQVFQADDKSQLLEWPWRPKTPIGKLLAWRRIRDDLAPGQHVLRIEPMVDVERHGELRIESVCSADASAFQANPK